MFPSLHCFSEGGEGRGVEGGEGGVWEGEEKVRKDQIKIFAFGFLNLEKN